MPHRFKLDRAITNPPYNVFTSLDRNKIKAGKQKIIHFYLEDILIPNQSELVKVFSNFYLVKINKKN